MQNCSQCGHKTDVYDSRLTEEGNLRRKRKCRSCGYRYATIELLDEPNLQSRPTKKVAEVKPVKAKPLPKGKPEKTVKKKVVDDDMYESYDSDYEVQEIVRDLGLGDFT